MINPHSKGFRRTFVVAALPVTITWAIGSRLWNEMKSAIFLAKNDVSMEIDEYRRIWRGDGK